MKFNHTKNIYGTVFLVALLLSACGGGGTSGTGGTTGNGGTTANVLQSISVSPAFISTNTGTTQQLTATGTYADGSTADVTSSATWVSADTAIASVSNTGLVAAGGTVQAGLTITASIGAAAGNSRVSVSSPAATLISISVPFNQTIYAGKSWLPSTWADAAFSNGTGQSPYTFVKWTVSGCTPSNAATVNADGTIAANAQGSCTITASSGALTSAARTLTIKAPAITSIIILPAPVRWQLEGICN